MPDYADSVLRALRRIVRAVDWYSRRLVSRYGLSGPQLLCLRQLVERGAQTPGQLARGVSLTPPTLTGILDRLEARELVARERRSQDKRQVLVQITDAGEELLARCPPSLQERFTARLAALPEAEQARISEALEKVVTLMEAEDIDASPLLTGGEPRRGDDPGETEQPRQRVEPTTMGGST